MNSTEILKPVYTLFALYLIVLLRLASLRLMAIRKKTVPLDYFKTFQVASDIPNNMAQAARNFINLFEVPVLFFVVCIMIFITGQIDPFFMTLAWIYVALRYTHSLVHLTVNVVQMRFAAFLLSNITLVVIWIRLGMKLWGEE